jgi:uncharacterized protein YcfJ
MNIKDLPQNSYKVVQPAQTGSSGKVNVKDLPAGSFKVLSGETTSSDNEPKKEGYFKGLTNPQNPNGILPYEAIDKALAPTSLETNKDNNIGTTIKNDLKSATKFVAGVANFLDPVIIGKKIGEVVGGSINYGKELGQQAQSEKAVKDYISKLQETLIKARAAGKDTKNIERLIKENGGAPAPITLEQGISNYKKELPKAIYETATPAFIKKGVEAGKNATPEKLAENNFGKTGTGARIFEGIHAATQDLAEDPYQLAPYFLMAKGAIESKLPGVDKAISKTASPVIKVGEKIASVIPEAIKSPIKTYKASQVKAEAKVNDQIIKQRTNELENIENNYAKLRKNRDFSQDQNASSRQRVASTDVLVNAVDEAGTINTKKSGGAIEQYKKMTLDHAEGVVRKNLVRLNETVNLSKVESELTKAVYDSGLEGADLKNALNNVKKEISGYRLKADVNGDVPLALIHDAKISTTNGIDYNTPADVKAYRKAIARGLKKTVEKNSEFPVEDVNKALSPYLQDIKYLESLDGRKVKGGKLGKYFSQVTGTMIGGAMGSAIGGPIGSAIGGIAGREISGKMVSSNLSKTFGKESGRVAEQHPTIKKAVELGNTPPEPITINNYRVKESPRNQTYNPINKNAKSKAIISDTLPQTEKNVKLGTTAKPMDLKYRGTPEQGSVKVNDYRKDSRYPKYITPDLINRFKKVLDYKENANRPIDMGTKPVIKKVIPMGDMKVMGGIKKVTANDVPVEYANKSFEQIKDHTAELAKKGLEENQQALSINTENYYSSWNKTAQDSYKVFKKIFNAWKDNPEDFAQLTKTKAGSKLREQIYDVAKQMDVTEGEVFELFKDRLLNEGS